MDPSLHEPLGWVAALAAGLLIGIERERSQPDEQSSAGLRSFALAALAGAVAQRLGAAALAAALLGVAALAVAGYWRSSTNDPGLTTELALLLSLLLGALAMRQPALASALAVLSVLLLVAKARLHGFARRVLSEQELQHALLLAVAVLVVLPLLPDRGLGWLGGLNPHLLWTLAVLLMLMQSLGHVALRWLGPERGLALSGLFGGLVSSTATIAALAQRAGRQREAFAPALAGALWSNVATVAELAVMAAVVSPALLGRLAPGLLLAAGVTVGAAWWGSRQARRQARRQAGDASRPLSLAGQPFSARGALVFAGVLGLVLFVADLARRRFGGGGVLVATTLAGFADAHASAVSALQLHAAGMLPAPLAAACVAAAFSSNSISKVLASATARSWRFSAWLAASQVATVAGLWAGLALAPWLLGGP